MTMTNSRFKNWAIGTITTVIIFPLLIQWVLLFFRIRSLTFLEIWGCISLILVLIEGYRLAKLPSSEYGKKQ